MDGIGESFFDYVLKKTNQELSHHCATTRLDLHALSGALHVRWRTMDLDQHIRAFEEAMTLSEFVAVVNTLTKGKKLSSAARSQGFQAGLRALAEFAKAGTKKAIKLRFPTRGN
jgi:hypothetical protein